MAVLQNGATPPTPPAPAVEAAQDQQWQQVQSQPGQAQAQAQAQGQAQAQRQPSPQASRSGHSWDTQQGLHQQAHQAEMHAQTWRWNHEAESDMRAKLEACNRDLYSPETGAQASETDPATMHQHFRSLSDRQLEEVKTTLIYKNLQKMRRGEQTVCN